VCRTEIQADFYAYADQDDIWMPDKLSRALVFLERNLDQAAMYCSRTELVTSCGKSVGKMSPLFPKLPTFVNALVQSLAGGNTMVINHRACELLRKAGEVHVVSHDWWTY